MTASINVSTAATAELVAFYNKHAAKPVNKFADRKTAERRVNALLDELKVVAVQAPAKKAAAKKAPKAAWVQQRVDGSPVCPECGGHVDVTAGRVVETRSGQHIVDEHIAHHHVCGHVWNMNTGRPARRATDKTDVARALAISESWKNPEVAAARATRHAVRVTDPNGGHGTYKSVREAFLNLALPLGRHIKFRGQLKAAGKAEINGFKFRLIAGE